MIMKKYFIFAAVAAAGLFASCSSSDDIAANDAQNPIEDPDKAPQIRLNIGNIVDLSTRGTGTVGGVGTGTNKWAGQHINVFMFTKDENKQTTLNLTDISTNATPQYLYNNTDMVTPGSAENLIPGMGVSANRADGEAMISDGTIQYYPLQGNFDFFGYHVSDANENQGPIVKDGASAVEYYSQTDIDDAAAAYSSDNVAGMDAAAQAAWMASHPAYGKSTTDVKTPASAGTLWKLPFLINGTQDVMSTKAALTTGQSALVGDDYYSAKAARKEVQPTLTFKHLLTRLQFALKAGNDAAGGVTVAGTYSQAEADDYNATLTGALPINGTTALTEAQADAYNATLTGALPINGTTPLTEAQADAYNATLANALPINGTTTLTEAQADAYNATLDGALPINGTTELTATQANAYNATLTNAVAAGAAAPADYNTKVGSAPADNSSLTAEEAIAYNATLDNAKAAGSTIDAATAKAWNADAANVTGAVARDGSATLAAATAKAWNAVAANVTGAVARTGSATLDADLAKAWNAVVANVAGAVARTGSATLDADKAKAYNATLTGHKSAGDAKAGGVDATLAVKVTDIKALSENTEGDLAVAWTGDLADNAKITWKTVQPDEDNRWLALMERPAYKQVASPAASLTADDFTDLATKKAALDNTAADYATKLAELNDEATARYKEKISAPIYALLTTAAQANYEEITIKENEKLIALTPTSPNVATSETGAARYPETAIGEAIILSPSTENIALKVSVTQKVKTNWDGTTTDKSQTYPLTITAPTGGFLPNTSYKVILTVYGFERIEVHTVIVPWEEGTAINIGQD